MDEVGKVNWWNKNVAPAIIVAVLIGAFGFFVDFQDLKAKVIGIEIKFEYINKNLMEIKADLKELKRGKDASSIHQHR
jgi:hypothetical protein